MDHRHLEDGDTIGRYMEDLRRYPPISREEEEKTVARAKKGDRAAIDHLVTSNLRFVVNVASSYRGRGLPLQELIAEGNLGLMKALDRFDPDRGYKFISYAVWWIHQSIRQALKQNSVVAMPSNRQDDLTKLSRRWAHMSQELGRTPSLQEVSDDLALNRERAERAVMSTATEHSLDRPLDADDDKERSLLDVLVSDAEDPDVGALDLDRRERLEEALDVCDEREAHVIRNYFGLEGNERRTLVEIGRDLGISRERARQLKQRSLRRMRRSLEALASPGVRSWREMI